MFILDRKAFNNLYYNLLYQWYKEDGSVDDAFYKTMKCKSCK